MVWETKPIRAGSVRTAITAIGQANVLDHGVNPTKAKHSEKLTPRLAQMMDGFEKEDPPTEKEVAGRSRRAGVYCEREVAVWSSTAEQAVQISIPYESNRRSCAHCFLLSSAGWRIHSTRDKNWTKQTKQFCLKDVTFFKRDENNKLTQISRGASNKERLAAHSATMRIRNQKNGWKKRLHKPGKEWKIILVPG